MSKKVCLVSPMCALLCVVCVCLLYTSLIVFCLVFVGIRVFYPIWGFPRKDPMHIYFGFLLVLFGCSRLRILNSIVSDIPYFYHWRTTDNFYIWHFLLSTSNGVDRMHPQLSNNLHGPWPRFPHQVYF